MKTRSHKKTATGKTIFTGALTLATLGLVLFAFILNDLPDPKQFQNRQVAQSTKIFDRTGQTLLYEIHGEEKRTAIPFEEIPAFVKQATIAIEDKNFYTNPGFDWRGILRAIIKNFLSRDFSQGGSTITQQLARNAFLSSEKTIIRKFKELIVAIELEKRYSKDEILSLYLNQIPYGNNAYGIEAAAQTFFNKRAKELNLPEAALLASLPKATSYYSPWGKHVNELLQRKNIILEKMREAGYITKKEKERAITYKLQFNKKPAILSAPHFVLEVQEYLNNKYGEEYIQTAGLNVVTALDWNLQQLAEKIVKEGADRNKDLYQGYNAALVAEDATTGQILALVGSKDYFGSPEPENCVPGKDCKFEGNFNVAVQGKRQPGSAIKPFAYTVAFKKGFSPDTMLFDLPTEFAGDNPQCPTLVDFSNDFEECYHPRNFDEKFRGPVTIREALAQSINIPAVKTLYLAGIDNLLKLTKDFGITTLTERSRYGLSLVLGGGEVTLKELVGAYSVLAQEGIKRNQVIILKIADSKNNIVEEYKDLAVKVIEPQYPRLINDILADVDARSALLSASLGLTVFPGQEVALKTGTSNDYRDAWAIGYTPNLVVGVWAGNNDNTAMHKKGSSILAAIPIWSPFMREALKTKQLISFNKPGVTENNLKPMLNKDYVARYQANGSIYPHIHNILYYADKNNPLGAQPSQPENDPQFKNWEDPVIQWAEKNIPDFSLTYNRPLPIGAQTVLESSTLEISSISFLSPANGDFLKSKTLPIKAQLNSQSDIHRIQLLFNNELADDQIANFGKSTVYQFNLTPQKIELQNTLKIKVVDSLNKETAKEIILFK